MQTVRETAGQKQLNSARCQADGDFPARSSQHSGLDSLNRPNDPGQGATQNAYSLPAGWLLTCLVSVVSWIICETLGGLLFLALGTRLWAYHITPILWAIASYVGWCYVFVILGTGCLAYLVWEHGMGVAGRRRWLYRSLFLVIAGPITEVIWNHATWNVLGTPLYLYTYLPTFAGSGSLLSPLYYQTLLLGFWVEEWIPGTMAAQVRCRT